MKCKYILLSSIFLYDFSAVQTAMAQNDRTPNIIYIMSDDHASQAVSAYGGILSTVLPTPNIDRIAHEGAILRNCFVTNSIEVKGTARTIAERSSEQARALKEMRKNGGVPCVLYGGNEVVHFTVTNEGLRNLVYTPHIYVVDLVIDGKKDFILLSQ